MLFEFLTFFNRPIAPHLTIYLPQISSISSIFHRFSGIFLIFSVYIFILFHNLIVNYYYFNYFNFLFHYFFLFNLFFLNLEIIFYYHFINGLRFIFINFGFFVNVKAIWYIYLLFLTISFILVIKFLIFNF